jgi:ketosteroid isomerase-like protein
VLSEHPRKTMLGLQQHLFWTIYNIDGTPTFVLTHILAAADGNARAVVQRQYCVSTGYNAEQAVAGFLPVQEGTLVAYVNHTFTDQVAGFGGSVKRNIGRSVMLKKLKEVFEAALTKATK